MPHHFAWSCLFKRTLSLNCRLGIPLISLQHQRKSYRYSHVASYAYAVQKLRQSSNPTSSMHHHTDAGSASARSFQPNGTGQRRNSQRTGSFQMLKMRSLGSARDGHEPCDRSGLDRRTLQQAFMQASSKISSDKEAAQKPITTSNPCCFIQERSFLMSSGSRDAITDRRGEWMFGHRAGHFSRGWLCFAFFSHCDDRSDANRKLVHISFGS